jgi:hypothetical protein
MAKQLELDLPIFIGDEKGIRPQHNPDLVAMQQRELSQGREQWRERMAAASDRIVAKHISIEAVAETN